MCSRYWKYNRKSQARFKWLTRRHRVTTHKPARKKGTTRTSKIKQGILQKVSGSAVTGWRLWLFRVICLTVIPAVFVLLVELSLRIVGFGFPSIAIVKYEENDVTYCCDNVKFGWRFFPRNIAQEFDPFIFPADKSDNTYRVFILGASAAQGTPDPAYCFSRILQVMLRNSYPNIIFEVVVTAMPAINSHVAVEIARDCARHEPDLFVVYMGNNEVIGPYGAGTVFAPLSTNLSLIRTGIALRATRLGQLLTSLSESVGGERDVPKVWRGLEMFLDKQVRADDPQLETVYRHFRRNLEDICDIADRAGIKVVLCTVGDNLKDCPPLASLHRLRLSQAEKVKWEGIYRQGVAFESTGDYTEAVKHYLDAAEIDDRYADLQFRLGYCYWAMGEYDKAKYRYVKARELDTIRFRADNRINQTICAVGHDNAGKGVYLVDAVKLFEQDSPHRTTGKELFHEHVHLNFKGNYILAKAIFDQMEKIFPQWVQDRKAPERSALSEAQCAECLAYNDWAEYNTVYKVVNYYIKKPPFTNQLYHDQKLQKLERELKTLQDRLTHEVLAGAADQYRQLIEKEPSDVWLRWRYAELLSVWLKNEAAAAHQCRLTLKILPHSYKPHLTLALSLLRLGHLNEAIDHLLKATQIKPTCADAYHCLGLTYQAQGQIDKAIRCYSAAVRHQPNNTEAYKNMAELLSKQGKVAKAIQTYRKGLSTLPHELDLHYNLAILLEKQGNKDEAIKELSTVLQIDPNHIEARNVMRAILTERK